jgi:hypothetical protein
LHWSKGSSHTPIEQASLPAAAEQSLVLPPQMPLEQLSLTVQNAPSSQEVPSGSGSATQLDAPSSQMPS